MLLLQRDWSLEAEPPKYLADEKDGKVNKGIFDIHVIDVYFTSVYSNPQYLILVQLLKSSNSKTGVAE